MSQATVYQGVAYLSGQVGADPDAGVRVQTEQALEKIENLLGAVGSDKRSLLGANIWLADISTFDEMNEAWESWVPEGHTPARATVESGLAQKWWKVEIMVWAASRGVEAPPR